MFQFTFRKNVKCIEQLSIDAYEEHSFDEPVQRQTMRKFGVGRTLTVELPNSNKPLQQNIIQFLLLIEVF